MALGKGAERFSLKGRRMLRLRLWIDTIAVQLIRARVVEENDRRRVRHLRQFRHQARIVFLGQRHAGVQIRLPLALTYGQWGPCLGSSGWGIDRMRRRALRDRGTA